MADACSLSKEGLMDCGSSRGRTETMFLCEYRDDVTTHPKDCFLSRANLKEYKKKKKTHAAKKTYKLRYA